MFHQALAPSLAATPDDTPGRRAFQVLVRAVEACQTAGVATATGDPFRLASLVWAAEHGLVSLRLSRPQFPWADIDGLIDQAVTGIMGLRRPRPGSSQLHIPATDQGGHAHDPTGKRGTE